MQSIINFFLGNVLLEVRGSYPERFFNLCARAGLEFWDMTVLDIDMFRVRMTVANFRKLPPIARKAMCRVHIAEKRGWPFFVNRFRKRAVLVTGFLLFCIVAWIFTGFVWVINIDGFSGLDVVKLKEELEKEGLRIGAYTRSIDISALKNNVLINMPELAYVSVNFNGSHADVTARKRTLPPEILPEETPCDIIAEKDGVIYDITVKTGTAEVVRGETVVKGQLLASGYVTGRAGITVTTHADADIRARTWRRMSARMPKKYAEKVYTGDEKNVWTIILFNNRIKLYINSGISYAKCDKIIERTDLEFFGGIRLPISLEKATLREYEIREAYMADETAYICLSDGLHARLDAPESGEIVDVKFETSHDDRFAYATLRAEYIEKIGIKREMLRNR
ncbi:MAG: sporulation protein YqfD [Oscillospiraceae bacterium]|nr:sporulation protein YqfD [Oscillospiraceae bacterium]